MQENDTNSVKPARSVMVDNISICNEQPFVLFGGLNVLETYELTLEVARHFQAVCQRLQVPLVFKASFDKANRTSLKGFRGPGLEQGLKWLAQIKQTLSVPVITDVHEPCQVPAVAQVADILQLPAFLCRQTDLVIALAKAKKPVNIKKAQFLAPKDMQYILEKFLAAGQPQLLLCERGSCFGYHNLIVDMLGFGIMKQFACPVIFDVTHALQQPGGQGHAAGGRRAQVLQLARAGIAQGIAGLFLEAHPNPEQAKCDGPCALRLEQLAPFLEQIKAMDELVKSLPELDTA